MDLDTVEERFLSHSVTTHPLLNLEELWDWDEDSVPNMLVGNSIENYSRRRNHPHPETLLCHDMKGGYLDEDKFDGCEVTESTSPFILFHWWYIDIFVYFSHNFITIPPVGWINQAHKHGVIVLGTLITEWDGGASLCAKFLRTEENVIKTAQKLVDICVKYNFEGWLINIENNIEKECIENLELFLATLTEEMRRTVGERSRVIWYDSVTVNGELKWQNGLNTENQKWFDITDGIFLNYTWKVKQLSESAARAKRRHYNVFVGIDCFGRGCRGGGGWNCHEAFTYCRQYDLSVALFAPGWIVETMPCQDVIVNSLRFWDRLVAFLHPHPLTSLPIETDFNHGYWIKEDECKRYALSAAKMQPHFLSSGIFPKSDGKSIIFPGPGLYRLFVTKLLLNGTYHVEAECDSKLQLMLWKQECCEEKTELIERVNEEEGNVWDFQIQNETIFGIGMLSSDFAILHHFIFRRSV